MMDKMGSERWELGAAFLPASISYLIGARYGEDIQSNIPILYPILATSQSCALTAADSACLHI